MLIKNARFVLTPEKTLENKNIVVKDSRIESIGGCDKSEEVIDASNHIVLPGLVNMHTHASMNLLRGVSDDKKLQKWLQEDIWPLEEKLDGEKCYWGAMHAFTEMIKTGTTCFSDMYFFMDKVAEAAEDIGIRGYLGHGMLDLGEEQRRKKDLKKSRKIVKDIGKLSDRINPMVTPHSCETCSDELLLKAREMADRNDIPLHMHLCETHDEVEKLIKERGRRPVEHIKQLGLLDGKFIGAHGVHLTVEDIKTLSKKEASIVHNPCSNMKLTSGVAPVPDMMQKGLNVCLGTDGAASNNNLDMFEEMKFVGLLHKLNASDPTTMPIEDISKLPWTNADMALDRKIGRLEQGYNADLILVDLDYIKMNPVHSPLSNLIYSGAEVDTTIIDGEIVMRNGELTMVDENKIKRKAGEFAEELVSCPHSED